MTTLGFGARGGEGGGRPTLRRSKPAERVVLSSFVGKERKANRGERGTKSCKGGKSESLKTLLELGSRVV